MIPKLSWEEKNRQWPKKFLTKNHNNRTLIPSCVKVYYTTSHPLGWLLSKKKANVGENVEELEPCALLVGMPNGAAAVENSMAVP